MLKWKKGANSNSKEKIEMIKRQIELRREEQPGRKDEKLNALKN